MVTAGVFLVCRCSPMFELAPEARNFVVFIGATTAFFAASVGLFQNDIKRVIAYSTCSQLGYMFAAAGVSAYGSAMFHLFTHAFFKALLFLSAGAVIHSMHHEQDMRKMGGLARAIPFTWAMMLIGNLALTGVGIPVLHVGLAGFYSKDSIIDATYEVGTGMGTYAFVLTLVAAGMTSFYSWRQFLMTFHGRYRGRDHDHAAHATHADHAGSSNENGHAAVGVVDDDHGHGHHAPRLEDIHESPMVMLVPLGVLAFGAVFAGILFDHYFIGALSPQFWNHSLGAIAGFGLEPQQDERLPHWVEVAPIIMTAIGFAIAYYYYILHPDLPRKLAARRGMLYLFLFNKWYFDELYDLIFVRPAFFIGRFLWKKGDGMVIDGLGPDGISARVLDAARGAVRLQSGYVYHYALAMLLGVVALATWFMATGGVP
jgi:NADH-quinone oxidoreductase subunit L